MHAALFFETLIFADSVHIHKISAVKIFQSQPSAKISAEKKFQKFFFS